MKMKHFIINSQRSIFAIGLVVSVLLAGSLLIKPHSVHAAANDNYQNIPPPVINNNRNCQGTSNPVAQDSWLSLRNQPLTTVTTVGYGAQSVDLQMNMLVYVCDPGLNSNGDVNASRTGTNYLITSTNPANIPGLINTQTLIRYGWNYGNNRWNVQTIPFTYTFPAPATSNQTVQIDASWKAINIVGDVTRYECVTDPPQGPNNYVPSNISDFGACNSFGGTTLLMQVNVQNPIVQAHVFKVDTAGNSMGDVSGATLTTCTNPASITTGSNGFAYINNISPGTGFCLRVSSSTPVGYSGPYVRPWSQGYYTNDTGSGGPSGPSCPSLSPNPPNGFGGPPYTGHCNNPAYEWQVAGSALGYRSAPTGTFFDRSLVSGGYDGGYDFVYVRNPQVDVCPNIAGVQPTVPNGWALDGSGNCTQPDYPYLRVYGGDVLAGSGFGDGCTALNPSASIKAFNLDSPSYAGAGAQLAVFAKNTIDQFASSSSGGAKKPRTLSFANLSGYGGNFAQTFCASDYWQDAPASPPTSLSISSTSVPDSTNPVVYVHGDVKILGNITYTNSGSWADTSKIPSYTLVVKGGNIYIDNSVTKLDGTYVAIPEGSTGGAIYTCTNNGIPYSSPIPATSADCGNQLVINGSFIAGQVKFLRTNGSLKTQVATPYAWSGWITMNNGSLSCPAGSAAAGMSPAVTSWGTGRLDVFYRGGNDHLIHCYSTNADNNQSSTWASEDLGGTLTSSPEAVSWGTNRIDVFARGTDNAIWHTACNGACTGASWAGAWDSWGGCSSSGPAVSSWAVGRLDVIVSACPSTNGIWHGAFNTPGGWSGFVNNLNGQAIGDPGAVSWGPNRDDFFVRGTTNLLYHNAWNGSSFSGWLQEVSGNICSGPTATAPAMNQSYANRVDIFAMGCNSGNPRGLYQAYWDGSWHAFSQIDSDISAKVDPAAVSWGDNRFDIFNFNGNSNPKLLWEYYDVVPRPDNPAAVPGELSTSSNIAEVFVYGPELWIHQ